MTFEKANIHWLCVVIHLNRDIDKHPIVHLKCLDNTCREFYVVCGPEAYSKVYDTYILETDTDFEYYQCVFNITLICKEDNKINAGELIVDNNSDINKLDTLL